MLTFAYAYTLRHCEIALGAIVRFRTRTFTPPAPCVVKSIFRSHIAAAASGVADAYRVTTRAGRDNGSLVDGQLQVVNPR